MDFSKVYIYRMTHIENIPHVIIHGITHKNSQNAYKNYLSIGDTSIINTRSTFQLKNELYLGDYIPFYFGVRSPMLYVIQNGFNGVTAVEASDIVYCVSSVQKIIDSKIDFIYTDGHATDNFTEFYNPNDIADIQNQVDFEATKQKFWKDDRDLDLKRRKEAEFLILQDLSFDNILGFVTFDAQAKRKLTQQGIESKKVVIKPHFYF